MKPWVDGQHGEIPAYSTVGSIVPGVPGELSLSSPGIPNRENEEDTAERPNPYAPTVGGSKGHSKVCGNASASVRAIWQALLHYGTLQYMMNSVAPTDQSLVTRMTKFSVNLNLTEGGKMDLSWWISLKLGLHDGVTPCVPYPRYKHRVRCIQHRLGSTSRGSPNRRDVVKERVSEPHQLSGAVSSLPSTPVLHKTEERYHCTVENGKPDSGDLHKQNGRTHSQALCSLAISLWDWSLQWNIYLVAEYLPGKENTVADQESRAMRDRCDWMLNPHVFNEIQSQSLTGPCKIDLFALRLTKQLPRFFSWRLDPEAERTDAFSQNWSIARCYANPPWCLIPCCQSQARQQMVRVVIITPLWNSQPWFPTILRLKDFRCLLPTRADLVILPTDQELIMKQGVPDLVAWPISGNPSHHKEFMQRVQTSSYPPGKLRPS